MAEPTPIFVTPSTTVVQVNTLLTPYTPVILNAYNYAGQIVTVRDNTSSFGVTQSSIVVSTQVATQFYDGSISTLITQPQGFITVQAQAPNTWSFLNTFPFWNQTVSATTQNLTTSNLYAFATSTLQEITSSVTTQNLIVSGNLTLKAGITLNQTISSLGSVNLFSTVTGYEAAFFSSGFSTLGAVSLASSLQVDGNVITPSSIRFLSTVRVSTSVSAINSISTSLVNLSGGLTTFRLIVQNSTPTSIDSAGSLFVTNSITGLSTLNAGRNFEAQTTSAYSFSTLSSMVVADTLAVSRSAIFLSNVSTQGSLVVKGILSTGSDTRVLQDISGFQNTFIQKSTLVKGTLSTTDFQAQRAWIQGNLQVDPTVSFVTTAQDITVEKNFGVGDLLAMSTTIGGTFSTVASAHFQGNVFAQERFFGRQHVSTTSSFSTLGDVYVFGALSTFGSLLISSSAIFQQDLQVYGTSYWNQFNQSSSIIRGDLRVLGNLTVTQTLTLSSIVLPSSLIANNFQVSSLFVGYTGTASNVLISSLTTSSLATGGIVNPSFTMDMSNVFQTVNLSTFLLSSLEFQAKSEGTFAPSTFFQAMSSFGVNTIASTNTFDVNTTAYTLSNINVLQNLSANTMFGGLITGTLQGNGSLLSNINYPAQLSTGILTTSSLISKRVQTNQLTVSSITADLFATRSTLTVGQMNIFGNALFNPNTSTLYFATPTTENNVLAIGNTSIFGNGSGTVKKQVILNSNVLPNFTNTNYTLGVGGTMRVNEISSPNFIFPFDTYRADILVTTKFISAGSINVNSGNMGFTGGTFFISESDTVQMRSTNIIQPSLSTLQFNSTMFVNQEFQRVGINTQPYYTLDVKSNAYVTTRVTTQTSSIIQNQIRVRQTFSTFWFATNTSVGSFSNIVWSTDGENWSNYSNYTSPAQTMALCNIAFNGGTITQGEDSSFRWIACGQEGIPNGLAGFVNLDRTNASVNFSLRGSTGTRTSITNVAYNGYMWVATCATTGGFVTDALLYSIDGGDTWERSVSGGFAEGGQGVAWNGSYWIAVGKLRTSPESTIARSEDGSNWTNATSGGFTGTNGGYAVLWTGSNWVATGDGNESFSFLTSTDGLNWTAKIGYGFINPKGWGRALGWDGRRLVAVGTAGTSPQSIQYSDDYGETWTVASGSLFEGPAEEGYSVVWNGSYWLAGGAQGFRKSYDGSTWFTPSAAPGLNISGLSWASNVIPSMIVGRTTFALLSPEIPVYDQLQFYNNPLLPLDSRYNLTPYIGYTSSVLNVNGLLKFNENNNIGKLSLRTSFTSSFYQDGTTLISGVLSTNAVFYQGGYYLDIQNV
jgi:hypothetical protein